MDQISSARIDVVPRLDSPLPLIVVGNGKRLILRRRMELAENLESYLKFKSVLVN